MEREELLGTLRRAADALLRRQREDGAFDFCCEVNPLPDAMMALCLRCVSGSGGRSAAALAPLADVTDVGSPFGKSQVDSRPGAVAGPSGVDPLMSALCDRLESLQDADGAWRAYPDQPDNPSATALVCATLLLCGRPADGPVLRRGLRYLARHGGLDAASHMVKILLATAGQYPWNRLPGEHIDFALLGPGAPLSLYDFSSYARVHMPPFMILRHLRHRFPESPHPALAPLLAGSSRLPPPRTHFRHTRAIRRCRDWILARLEPNGTLASYVTATVLAVFALQAVGDARDTEVVRRAIAGMKEMVRPVDGMLHQQVFTSTVWDTALALQALHAASGVLSGGIAPAGLRQPGHVGPTAPASDAPTAASCGARPHVAADPLWRAAQYLVSRQQDRRADWCVRAPGVEPGGWGFSDVNTLYPDVDDTAAALRALYPYRREVQSAWMRGVRWLIKMQNDDGGWGAFERDAGKRWLERLPINDMGQAMTDPSSADLTGRVLETLASMRIPAHRAIADGVRWLERAQRPDGSWRGRWGICFLYGTFAAVAGLAKAGLSRDHPAMRRARSWLCSVQHADGSFGESCQSDEQDAFVDHAATPTQTAWGLMALLACAGPEAPQTQRAARALVDMADEAGGWAEPYPTGAGIAGQAYIRYHSYPMVWPLMALSRYAAESPDFGNFDRP
ncbi:prenyltransferase/squalene oxidase repeat-containing protein [Alicyclobacillus sp.]|uniref:prenyltransferase/squalene oxidase repeat-containing protein n=1 Tax=Alicyclobacillus sp. TaxID=61169 RepID=UPI0025C513E9|nr:prenyltransferase/squalene oxidase repeat-containing protein [Alicyclobacillus sp.]MCL6517108.1 hypothetical protein [Alicyclobacillus sp.]